MWEAKGTPLNYSVSQQLTDSTTHMSQNHEQQAKAIHTATCENMTIISVLVRVKDRWMCWGKSPSRPWAVRDLSLRVTTATNSSRDNRPESTEGSISERRTDTRLDETRPSSLASKYLNMGSVLYSAISPSSLGSMTSDRQKSYNRNQHRTRQERTDVASEISQIDAVASMLVNSVIKGQDVLDRRSSVGCVQANQGNAEEKLHRGLSANVKLDNSIDVRW